MKMYAAVTWATLSRGHEDLTENFCTRNENVDELKKLLDVEKSNKK